MTTIKDVAKRAGVSIATVSYVLNDSGPVGEETRHRVLKAIKALDYRPSIRGRNLQAQESRIIGYQWFLTPGGEINPILDRFLYGLAYMADKHNYHLMLFIAEDDRVADVQEDLIRSGRVDGFVLANTQQDDKRIHHLMGIDFPFVSFGRANPEWDFVWVDIDGEAGLRQVMTHLLANGHHRIATVCWPRESLAGDSRVAGYLGAMQDAGLEVDRDWIFRGLDQVKTGFEAAEQFITLPSARRPTAIVAASDLLATGVLNYFSASDIRVGRDIAVVGFDNLSMNEYLSPPLSSVHQPIDRVAELVFDLLLQRLNGTVLSDGHQLLLTPELVVRASSDFICAG